VAAVLLAAAACGGGDDHRRPDPGGGATATSATTTTQASAVDDPDAAFDAVDRVVGEYAELLGDMYQDPDAALNDPDNDDLERYRPLFTEGLDTPDLTEQRLRDLVAAGRHMQPPSGDVLSQASTSQFSAVDADTVTFRACLLIDQETVDTDGNVVDSRASLVLGEGQAKREGGLWRFAGVEPDRSAPSTIEPGQASPNYCEITASINEGGTP
jgi:hypothetical protein